MRRKFRFDGNLVKILNIVFFVVLFIVFPNLISCAASSRTGQTFYSYRYLLARDAGDQHAQVICSDCPNIQRVTGIRKMPQLSIRTSAPVEPSREVAKMVHSRPVEAFSYVPFLTVRFGFNRSTIDKKEMDKLIASAKDVRGKHLLVKGFTCKIGNKEYNDNLANKRAMTVAGVLEKQGANCVSITGEGKCCYVSTKDAMNRRVEVKIRKGEVSE